MSYHKPKSRENRARIRTELAITFASECIVWQMTPEERERMEALPKPKHDVPWNKFVREGFRQGGQW